MNGNFGITTAGWRKVALVAGVLALALVTGACSKSESKKGGGGASIAPPPTARPTLTGPVRIDVSGSDGSTGFGGIAGQIYVAVKGGRLLEGAGPGRAGIDNNMISAASLLGGVVTASELQVDAGVNYSTNGAGTSYIDLFGRDFFIPAGVTLDLSDAVVGNLDTLVIRTHQPGDYIRIDGDVSLTRTGGQSVHLQLISGTATGVAISLDGMLTGTGSTNNAAGNVLFDAAVGSIAIGGTIVLTGGSGTTGNTGGNFELNVRNNHAWLAGGILQGNGGDGTAGGAGGNLEVSVGDNDQVSSFRWGVRLNGGEGTVGSGGSAGYTEYYFHGIVDYFSYCQANAGSGATSGGAAHIGFFHTFTSSIARGVLQYEINGGAASAGTGGAGGRVAPFPASFESFALVAEANGGDSVSGDGGFGGRLEGAYAYAGRMTQVLFDLTLNGGSGAGLGMPGGFSTIRASADATDVTVRQTSNGGNGGTANGGTGGSLYIESNNYWSGGNFTRVRLEVTALGGSSISAVGGAGGGIEVHQEGWNSTGWLTIFGSLNGGTGATGGAGGSVHLDAEYNMIDATIDVQADGGSGTTAGGNGGTMSTEDSDDSYILRGSFRARGGLATGAGATGGTGGMCSIYADGWLARLEMRSMNFDLRGGNSEQLHGGSGGMLFVRSEGTTVVSELMADVSGGTGSVNSGTGDGGPAGSSQILTRDDDLLVNSATIIANGGNGRGDGGSGGYVSFTTDSNSDGRGGYVYVNAGITANGGNSGVTGDGGMGGQIVVQAYAYGSSFQIGEVEVRGTFVANGGNGADMGSIGGAATNILVFGGMHHLRMLASLTANGGAGDTGGTGGFVGLMIDDSAALTIGGNINANGGAGATTGGSGGGISADYFTNGAVIVVNPGVTLRANGGGPNASSAGTIDLDSNSLGVTTTGATLETNDGTGTAVPGNISIS